MPRDPQYDYITRGADGGTVIGSTTSDKIGFFTTTPTTQQTLTVTTFATTGLVSTTTWAFSTSTLAISFVTAVDELLQLCANLGLGAT